MSVCGCCGIQDGVPSGIVLRETLKNTNTQLALHLLIRDTPHSPLIILQVYFIYRLLDLPFLKGLYLGKEKEKDIKTMSPYKRLTSHWDDIEN